VLCCPGRCLVALWRAVWAGYPRIGGAAAPGRRAVGRGQEIAETAGVVPGSGLPGGWDRLFSFGAIATTLFM